MDLFVVCVDVASNSKWGSATYSIFIITVRCPTTWRFASLLIACSTYQITDT